MPRRGLLGLLAAVVAAVAWAPATAFFGAIALAVARDLAARLPPRSAPIANVSAALVTAGYSLGGAALVLGVAWVALPRAHATALGRAALLWTGVTALLLGTRQVAGWPLLVPTALPE